MNALRARAKMQTRSRRGYALVMVFLLSLAAGAATTILLERQASLRWTEQQQVESYRAHHTQAGLRDMIEVSLRFKGINPSGKNPSDKTKETVDKPARLTIQTKDGGEIRVKMTNAQDRILTDSSGSQGEVMTRAAAIVRRDLPNTANKYLRTRGPARVDINSAERPVLEAIVEAIDPKAAKVKFADEVLRRREVGRIQAQDLGSIMGAAELPNDIREVLGGMFTTDCSLWRVVAQEVDRDGRQIRRTVGVILGDVAGMQLSNPWAFLDWKRQDDVPPGEEDSPVEADQR